jgi:hypothetical protein
MQTLLTTNNSKTALSQAHGWLTFGVHLAHADTSGFGNVCPDASEGCKAACLDLAGHGQRKTVQEARAKKTKSFFDNVPLFMARLVAEIEDAVKSAKVKGLFPCFRLNLTSDLAFERLRHDGKTVFDWFPNIHFYDYTKSLRRTTLSIPNYHLTFSRSETELNHVQCDIAIARGVNVAAVFSTKKGSDLPKEYKGRPVIDGDAHDLRFLDGLSGCYIGLRAKGPAKKDKSGFVIHI